MLYNYFSQKNVSFCKKKSLWHPMIYYIFFLNINSVRSNNLSFNYLQLLYREVKGILLYQRFPRVAYKTSRAQRGMSCRQNWSRERPWLSIFSNFPKKYLCTILSSFEMQMHCGSLLYLLVPRDVK